MEKHYPIFTTQLTPEQITPDIVSKYIKRHALEIPYLEKLERYYTGEHDIRNRQKEQGLSNNKLVTNHAKYIADFISGYLAGEPVSYTSETDADITAMTDALKKAKAYIQDTDLALDASKFGRAYEYIYTSNEPGTVYAKLARFSPLNAFVVYDDTVEQNPVFGVYYYPVYDADGNMTGYNGLYCTALYIYNFVLTRDKSVQSVAEPQEHPFGKVPLDEIYNDFERIGDYEDVISLIDAYNILQSDRVNDKEQFVNALLVIRGQVLGDTDEEAAETMDAIQQHGVMTLDRDADAAYLTRSMDESGSEILKTSIVHDIHKISCVPDMSDENFAGNVSGVAMRFKLLALEQRTKIKERFFTEGLQYRLECIANLLKVQGSGAINTDDIKITFTRSLPANEVEEAQVTSMLQGIVSDKTLLSRLSFVTSPEEEAKAVETDKQAALDRQQQVQQALMRSEYGAGLGNV